MAGGFQKQTPIFMSTKIIMVAISSYAEMSLTIGFSLLKFSSTVLWGKSNLGSANQPSGHSHLTLMDSGFLTHKMEMARTLQGYCIKWDKVFNAPTLCVWHFADFQKMVAISFYFFYWLCSFGKLTFLKLNFSCYLGITNN